MREPSPSIQARGTRAPVRTRNQCGRVGLRSGEACVCASLAALPRHRHGPTPRPCGDAQAPEHTHARRLVPQEPLARAAQAKFWKPGGPCHLEARAKRDTRHGGSHKQRHLRSTLGCELVDSIVRGKLLHNRRRAAPARRKRRRWRHLCAACARLVGAPKQTSAGGPVSPLRKISSMHARRREGEMCMIARHNSRLNRVLGVL